jgi:hypothetical protein
MNMVQYSTNIVQYLREYHSNVMKGIKRKELLSFKLSIQYYYFF